MKRSHDSAAKLERKTVEKNRRIHMKNLCRELASLIPPQHHSRVGLSQQDRLDLAADYIKNMEERIRELKSRKDAMVVDGINRDMSGGMMIGLRLPLVEVSDSGSTLKVVMISDLNKNVMLSNAIAVLEEEGAQVVSANQYIMDDRCFHILHSQVTCARVGYESERINRRLKELVQ